MDLDFEKIEEVLRVFSASAATELELETQGLVLKFKRPAGEPASGEPQSVEAQPEGELLQEQADEPVFEFVRADRVGFFHLGKAPDAEPLVQVGDSLTRGQQVGSIVAIGVVNPLYSELEGKVAELLLEDGQAVEFGEPLIKVQVPEGH